jgi:hypothetical protein
MAIISNGFCIDKFAKPSKCQAFVIFPSRFVLKTKKLFSSNVQKQGQFALINTVESVMFVYKSSMIGPGSLGLISDSHRLGSAWENDNENIAIKSGGICSPLRNYFLVFDGSYLSGQTSFFERPRKGAIEQKSIKIGGRVNVRTHSSASSTPEALRKPMVANSGEGLAYFVQPIGPSRRCTRSSDPFAAKFESRSGIKKGRLRRALWRTGEYRPAQGIALCENRTPPTGQDFGQASCGQRVPSFNFEEAGVIILAGFTCFKDDLGISTKPVVGLLLRSQKDPN